MGWQDFMFASIGVSVLGLSGALIFTLSKTWPILDNAQEVSEDVKDTGKMALRGPVKGLLRLLNIFTKGGEKNDKKKK